MEAPDVGQPEDAHSEKPPHHRGDPEEAEAERLVEVGELGAQPMIDEWRPDGEQMCHVSITWKMGPALAPPGPDTVDHSARAATADPRARTAEVAP